MRKINVLFMQSQTFNGADSTLHGLLMRHFDRSRVEVFAACNKGSPEQPSATLAALRQIPNLHLRPTYFGPSAHFVPRHIAVWRALTGGLPTLASLLSLASYIRANKIDIIHCTEKPRDAFYGYLLARATNARCVVHLHVKAENWISPLVRWAMGRADGMIAISQFVADSLRDMGYNPARTHVVLNGLELDRWDPTVDGSAVRAEYGVRPDETLLAIISRIFPWKGHGELLRALAIVRRRNPKFKLLIIGHNDPRATPGGGNYTDELEVMARELGLSEHVIFGGFRKDVDRVMAACDIFSMPSFEEPFGMVFVEAMAMKRPVIALANGGAPEVVEHGKSGLLSPVKDSEALAENILTLMADSELRRRMGEHGRHRAESLFNAQRMANEVEQAYRRIIAADSALAPGAALERPGA